MTKIIQSNLSDHATEYFGGDAQRFWIVRDAGHGVQAYRLYRLTHWLGTREDAVVLARNARDARKAFNAMACMLSENEHDFGV